MRNQIRIVLGIGVLGYIVAVCLGQVLSQPPKTLRLLRAENKLLRAQVEGLKKEVAALKTENGKLKRQLAAPPSSRPTSRPAKATSRPAAYVYRGRKVSKKWFEDKYRRFADKIVLLEGRYYDVGDGRARMRICALAGTKVLFKGRRYPVGAVQPARPLIGTTPPRAGSLCWTFRNPRVLQALGGDRAIFSQTTFSGARAKREDVLLHITGLNPARNIDGASLTSLVGPDGSWTPLVYVGPHIYRDVRGARRTIQSYRVYQPLSRPDFAKALQSGFRLVEHKKVGQLVKETSGLEGFTGGFHIPRTSTQVVVRYKVVAKAIP